LTPDAPGLSAWLVPPFPFRRKILARLGWWLPLLVVALPARAEMPPDLVTALHHLQDQTSYSWEVINGDPGLVAQNIETRRGTITTLQQSTSPHVLGSLAENGDILLQRDWGDGLHLDTLVTSSGAMITKTPEGWMTTREILTALADEETNNTEATTRYLWLKRADRPSVRRPDQELASLLKGVNNFEPSGDGYIVRILLGSEDEDAPASLRVTLTLHVTRSVIRTYEVYIEGTRSTARGHVQVPVTEDRIVIVTYLPVTKLDVPEEARARLATTR
jgi:hypothetical protein